MSPSVIAALLGLAALFLDARPIMAAEAEQAWGACPTYWEKDTPGCPSPEAMVWVDCPVKWPKDGRTALYFGTPHAFSNYNNAQPDWTRTDFNRSISLYLDCEYGPRQWRSDQRRHLTVTAPAPIIQYGWHKGAEGRTFGIRVLRQDKPVPSVIFPEQITETTTLEGVGLGWTVDELRAFAKREAYTWKGWFGEWNFGLYRPGTAIEVVLDPKTKRSREIILRAGWQDEDIVALRRKAVQKFGFEWLLKTGTPDKEVWSSADGLFVVEHWNEHRPRESASLHLIDKRPAESLR
jgi:hypothetical protein